MSLRDFPVAGSTPKIWRIARILIRGRDNCVRAASLLRHNKLGAVVTVSVLAVPAVVAAYLHETDRFVTTSFGRPQDTHVAFSPPAVAHCAVLVGYRFRKFELDAALFQIFL